MTKGFYSYLTSWIKGIIFNSVFWPTNQGLDQLNTIIIINSSKMDIKKIVTQFKLEKF